MISVFALGDVVGRAGRQAVAASIDRIKSTYHPDILLMNGENLAGGYGITKKIYSEFIDVHGFDAITTGNHWHDNKEIIEFADKAERLVLPANMSNVRDETMGLKILTSHNGTRFAVLNLIGRAFMKDGNRSPFDAAARLLERVPNQVRIRIVDIHAEATSEKQGMLFFLNGKVSLVYGTHSHVPTADERILPSGTGFVTDLGATAAYDSIIGMNKEAALRRMLTNGKERLEPAELDPWVCGIHALMDPESGQCKQLNRVQWRL